MPNEAQPLEFMDAWRRMMSILRTEIGERPYIEWIAPLHVVSVDNERIVLGTGGDFSREKVTSAYAEKIANLLERLTGVPRAVQVVKAAAPKLAVSNDGPPTEPVLAEGSTPLDKRATFQNFVVGTSNAVAFNELKRLASSEEAAGAPVIVFGPTGVGKSHLLQAYARQVLARDPSKTVLYATAEWFTGTFMASIAGRDTSAFKERIRSVDCLLIDDLQFFAGKAATTEELFHAVDHLIANGKVVMFTADRSPSQIENMPEKLRSRLLGGGGLQITPADLDLRVKILTVKAERLSRERPGFHIGDDVLHMIAARLATNTRVLEGVLNRLAVQSSTTHMPITMENAKAWLADFLLKNDRHVTIDEVKKHVAEHFAMKPQDLIAKSRRREIVRPRQIAMYLSRQLTQRSFPEIAQRFNKMDHTTVMHGCEQIKNMCAADPTFAAEVDKIKRSIRDWQDPDDTTTT